MAKEMLINVSEGEECRIALVEDGKLEELYMERTSSTSHVGNIYKGKVTNVEPSIQAAFIDFGLGRNGFLHITDLMPTYFGRKGEDIQEFVGKKMARRERPPIQRCLRRGDEIVVQVIKEGIGTKGPTLNSYLSVSGKLLVMMPGMEGRGVSRKIEDEAERRRLRQILEGLKPPDDCGFIIRTEAVGKAKAEIERDLKYLARLWENIKKKRDTVPAPVELYTEGDLVARTVRDVFSSDIDCIVVDNKDVAKRVKEVIKLSSPRTKNKVEVYADPIPLFHKYDIEHDIEMMYSRHVPLPSGGSLVIDSTEAIVAIDVNSGKFRDHADAETTAFKTDMEAADEICRQLRLRNLGGVVICDFIDLRYERHRRELERRLHENLKRDRAKSKFLKMSQFGIIEMTRSRQGPSLKRSIYFDCPHCKGAGVVKTPESMSLDVMRRLAMAINDQRVARVELTVGSDVSFYLQNKKRLQIAKLELDTQKRIVIRADQTLALDEIRIELFDARDNAIYMPDLGVFPPEPSHGRHGGGGRDDQRRHHGQQRGGRRDQRRDGGGRHRDRDRQQHEEESSDEGIILQRGEEAFEEREEHREEEAIRAARVGAPMSDRERRPLGAINENVTENDVDMGDDESDAGDDESDRDFNRRDQRPQGGGDGGGRGGHDQQGGQQQGEGGGRRRRRRRRGGRGRGRRNRQNQEMLHGGGPGGQGEPAYADDYAAGSSDEADRSDRAVDGSDVAAAAEDQPYDDVTGATESSEFADEQREPALFEDEVAAEVGGADSDRQRAESGSPVADGEVETEAATDADRPRRPRRRRSRRRGRSELQAEAAPESEEPAPVEEPSLAEADEPTATEPGETQAEAQSEGEGKRPHRRRRGGRGRGRRGRGGSTETAGGEAASEAGEDAGAAVETSRAEQGSAPVASSQERRYTPAPIVEVPAAPRTGSSDRHHLIVDEPVVHEPARRPRTYRDLDEIPDDLE